MAKASSSNIFLVYGEDRPQRDIPQIPGNVSDAAEVAVPAQLIVIQSSYNLPFPSAVNLLRLPFNARRDSLRHCIPLEFFRIVPSLSRFYCHLSPRYGILPP